MTYFSKIGNHVREVSIPLDHSFTPSLTSLFGKFISFLAASGLGNFSSDAAPRNSVDVDMVSGHQNGKFI